MGSIDMMKRTPQIYALFIPAICLVIGLITTNHVYSQEQATEQQDTIYSQVEVMPEPRGGLQKYMRWVAKNYRFTSEAMENGVNGEVVLSFVVEVNGSLSNIDILEDLGFGTGEAAVQMMQKSPRWKPGLHNGKPVRVLYQFPFKLKIAQ